MVVQNRFYLCMVVFFCCFFFLFLNSYCTFLFPLSRLLALSAGASSLVQSVTSLISLEVKALRRKRFRSLCSESGLMGEL